MSRKLKFKIISCSSEQGQHPVSSLLFSGSEGWQTRRFCTYPQQITLQFYGVANIRKIELVSDHRKIASQVDILYYVPTGGQEERFYKYGYLQFTRNDNGAARQQKTIMVDLNCLYLRLLFHKPHPSKENFFSQVGLQALTLYGSEQPDALMRQPVMAAVGGGGGEQGGHEEDEQYIAQFMARLAADKEQAIKNEDFDKAEQYKGSMVQISNLALRLREHRALIARAVEREDFDQAKRIKETIDRIKADIRQILQGQDEQGQAGEENEFAPEPPQDHINNQFMQAAEHQNFSSLPNSKVSNKLAHSRPRKATEKPKEDYDERVIPALRNDRVKSQALQQFGEQKPRQALQVEQVQGKYIKQATLMQQFFPQQTVRKFFSQHWQNNLDSLNSILSDIKKKNREPNLIRCLANIVKFSIRQTNFQISLLSLAVLQEMLRTNSESQSLTKPGDLQNDLDDIAREVIKKMTDNNPKIKTAAEQAFAMMVSSLLYGVETCSLSLTKNKAKLSSKQLATRLSMVTHMIDDYGLASGPNSVPLQALDFAIDNLSNSAEEVRRNAVGLLASAYRKDKGKTDIRISDLKDSIQNQIRGEGVRTPPKPTKKK